MTLCQQVLALALVVAALTPAARTITMDVRPAGPSAADAGDRADDAGMAAYLRSATAPATVPAAPVEPDVQEHSLTAPSGTRVAAGSLEATARRTTGGGERITSQAIPVQGYGAVGVTWAHGTTVAEDALAVQVRTQQGGTWSDWAPLGYHDDHGPDPSSAEARDARPGTDAMIVGDVDDVQVRIDTDRAAPADMKLAVIDPGTATRVARQAPSIDTSASTDTGAAPSVATDASRGSGDDLALATAQVAPRPRIFSRAQWGADERMRDKPSLRYHEVHAGFVHHTVSANDYTRAQVPGILRGIYAYHTRSQGWSDIGYNFLVDRFGRIWEGRYGGVNRPVVGAHTLGYNDDAFAMSAIGNFETVRPSQAMIEAYGALFAWKLGLHGVDALDAKQFVTSRNFRAINGHRDAGSTACPGRYLYNRLGDIRTIAANNQGSWAGRELESNLAGGKRPDLIVRRASDGRAFVLPVVLRDGKYRIGAAKDTGLDLSAARNILKAGDWDRDGYGDLIVRRADGNLYLYRGLGKAQFAAPVQIATGFGRVGLLAAVGDMTGDGWPDLVGRSADGLMRIYLGWGLKGIARSWVASSGIDANRQIPIGRWDGDGASDSFFRRGGTLTLRYGNGPGGFDGSRTMRTDVTRYDWLVGVSDVGLTGHADMIARERDGKALWLVPATAEGFGARVSLGRTATQYDLAG